jgi:hypothetical protein
MQTPPESELVAIAACTPHAWVRGIVELGRIRRLSDLLNHPGTTHFTLVDGEVLPFGAREWPRSRPRLYLNKADVLFLHPTATGDTPHSPPGLVVDKIPVAVGLYVGDYHIEGTLHVVDRLPWEQYFSVLRDRFLLLTDAAIARAVSGEEVARVGFVGVNRERLSVLYEV